MKVDNEILYRQIYRGKEEITAYDIFFELEANKINPELKTKTPHDKYLYFNSTEGYNIIRKVAELWNTKLKKEDKSFIDQIQKFKKKAIKKNKKLLKSIDSGSGEIDRINLIKKQSILEKKIIFLQKQYDEIDKELDSTATKYKKVKTPNEEGCNIC